MTANLTNRSFFIAGIHLPMLLLATFLGGCAEAHRMNETDRSRILTLEELPLKPEDRVPVKDSKGREYYLAKPFESPVEFLNIYTAQFANDGEIMVRIKRSATLREAREFYGSERLIGSMHSGREIPLSEVYPAEESYGVEDEGFLFVLLRKERVVYSLILTGSALKEREIRSLLLAKFRNSLESKE